MVRTTTAGLRKSNYSWRRRRFSALSMVQRKHRMRRTGQSLKHGRSNMELHGRLFSSRWRGHCSSSMVFRKTQRHCEISWRMTTSWRWSWMFGLCEMRCQLWNWAIVRMYRSTSGKFSVMWITSIFGPIPPVRLVVVRCQRASTPITWWRMYRRMIIGGFSPSWCMTKLTPWLTNRRRLSRSWKPTKRGNSRKSTWKESNHWHWLRHRERARSGVQSRLGSPGSSVVVAARAMVVIWRVRSIAAGIGRIPRNAPDAITWSTLHGIVQALHRWRAGHRQRQRQQQRQRRHQLRTIGWQLRIERTHQRIVGTWIGPPLLTFAVIRESLKGTQSIPRKKSGRLVTLLEGSQASPSDMEMCDWGFGCQDSAKIMTLFWETSCISKVHTTRFHNRNLWIGGCRLCLSTAMGSRYMAKCRLRVLVKIKVILFAWHARLQGYSGWIWSGWTWRLQERDIEREDRSSRHG